jgi:hypothetical protein
MTLRGSLPLAVFLIGIVAGAVALMLTPREEEPQIVVPMIDVLVEAPGPVRAADRAPGHDSAGKTAGADSRRRARVFEPRTPGSGAVTLRFYVGRTARTRSSTPTTSSTRTRTRFPRWSALAESSPSRSTMCRSSCSACGARTPERYSDFELRRIADEFSTALQAIPRYQRGQGRRRTAAHPARSPRSRRPGGAAHHRGGHRRRPAVSNVLQGAGNWTVGNRAIVLEAGDVLRERC